MIRVDGRKEDVYRFDSGVLSGAIRKVERLTNGVQQIVYSTTYSETGSLLREKIGSTILEYEYDNHKKLSKVFKDAVLVKTLEYNNGGLAKEIYANGLVRIFQHQDRCIKITNVLPNGVIYYETKDKE